jgi:hypothetical protein
MTQKGPSHEWPLPVQRFKLGSGNNCGWFQTDHYIRYTALTTTTAAAFQNPAA